MIRNAVVAGHFYPGSKTSLLREVESLIDSKARKHDAIGVVSPHAGYAYSGSVAGSVLSSIEPRSNYIIMGPNHTGLGERFGLDTSDFWATPLGEVKLNRTLADAIRNKSSHIKNDSLSHAHEHSVEVQIPFLQVLQEVFTIVPITVSYASLDIYREVGKAIAAAIKELSLEKDVTIIASSDMTHYEPHEEVKKKDKVAIDAVLALDEKKLIEKITEMDITMCGFAPTAIMIVAAKALGAKKASLVRYQTSGDTSGDYSSVVGYAGILIE